MEWKTDCKEFRNTEPCHILESEGYSSCANCEYYDPISKKILIIKLGAAGDVLRTTPLLRAIKKANPNAYISWLTLPNNVELLENNPYINKVLSLNYETILRLDIEHYDTVYNLEIDSPATMLASKIKAHHKYGYYHHADGHTAAYNTSAEYYLHRARSNVINRNNTKTYQSMMFDAASLPYAQEDYVLHLTDEEKAASIKFRKHYAISDNQKLIGINIGAGNRWPSKSWGRDNIIALIRKLNLPVVLLAGPDEPEDIQEKMAMRLHDYEWPILKNNPQNSMREYMAIINACDMIITGDTLTLHLGLALKKPTVGLFLVTPPWEVEEYGRLSKVVSPLLQQYFYTNDNVPEIAKSVSVDEVLAKVQELLHTQDVQPF